MPEKLLTLNEVSKILGVSEEELRRLVDSGDLPAYRIGGRFLRFRKEQIEAIVRELSLRKEATKPRKSPPKRVKNFEESAYPQTAREAFLDFFYFNDFYLISGLVIFLILWVIFKF